MPGIFRQLVSNMRYQHVKRRHLLELLAACEDLSKAIKRWGSEEDGIPDFVEPKLRAFEAHLSRVRSET